MKKIQIESYTCLVGSNAEENWEILSHSRQKHIFFHLASFPSCYVILQTEEKVGQNILEQCAKICAENTKYKHMSNLRVDCTQVSNVVKGQKVGEVYYKSNKKVMKFVV